MVKKEKKLPQDYVSDFVNELHEKTCEYVREKQGEKGYIDTQNLDNEHDTISLFVFDEGEERGVEMDVVGVKEENNELFVKITPVSPHTKIVFDEDDFNRDDTESGWFNIRYSNVYYASALISIAGIIHEYVLN